ncbi:unnamed protein product [Gadus morhua 'NCC']
MLSGGHRELRELSGGHRELRELSGGHRELSGGHRELSGGHRELSGGHRELSGGHKVLCRGCRLHPLLVYFQPTFRENLSPSSICELQSGVTLATGQATLATANGHGQMA